MTLNNRGQTTITSSPIKPRQSAKRMGHHRYRQKRSMVGGMLAEANHSVKRLSWRGVVILGTALFVVFYWLVPAWISLQLNSLQSNPYCPILEAVLARRIHWVQWLGIVLGLVCAFFALCNYFTAWAPGRNADRNVSFFSRLLARWLE